MVMRIWMFWAHNCSEIVIVVKIKIFVEGKQIISINNIIWQCSLTHFYLFVLVCMFF